MWCKGYPQVIKSLTFLGRSDWKILEIIEFKGLLKNSLIST